MKNFKLILFVTLVIPFLSIGQSNYYVSTNGNNSNAGSFASPWLTIQYGANQLSAGDTLNIMAGSYTGKIDINNSGSVGQVVTVRNYNNDNVIIDGSSLLDYEYLLSIENRSYVTIEGLKFQNYQKLDAIGINIVNSRDISILENEFSNIDYSSTALGETPNASQNSQPIIVFGRDPVNPVLNLKINGNVIHDCETGWSECLSINGNIDGFEVLNNHIYDNTNIPIVAIGHEGECSNPAFDQARNGLIKNNLVHDNPSAYAAAGGIYIDGAKDVVIENNTCYNNDYGIEVGCENNGGAPNDPSASNIMVRNNLLYNNGVTGIALGGYNYPTTGKVENTTIHNNTCYNNDTGDNYQGEMLISYTENSTIENNVFYTNNTEKVLFLVENSATTLSLNYNMFYTPTGTNNIVIEWNGVEYNTFNSYQIGETQDANSTFSDPLFSSAVIPSPDLHLSATSPAINAGNPSFIASAGELDMDGENRTSGIVDCGADEYYSNTGVGEFSENDIRVYPNPTTGKIFIPSSLEYATYKVVSVRGQLVAQGKIESNSIDLTDLKSGIYFVEIKNVNSGELYRAKVVKENS